ncbi:MAG: hypothetical protein VB118_11715 [Oscillospiraceae bacterium]|nr:hypothetical protein [Oscillospiraceae bacterium]
MKKYTYLIICVVFLITVVSCELSEKALCFDSRDGVLRMDKTADGWKYADKGKLNDEADIELINVDETAYIMLMAEKKTDLSIDFNEYRNIIISNAENRYGIKLDSSSSVFVNENGLESYRYEFDVSQDTINMRMYMYIAQTKNYYVQVYAWTLRNNFDNMSDELNRTVLSLREVSR